MAAALALLWAFPSFWYTKTGEGQMQWLSERMDVPGWSYHAIPVDESAERVLVADRMFSGGIYNAVRAGVLVFCAKAYCEEANVIWVLDHTPGLFQGGGGRGA